jgi:riboflavin transporter
MKNNQAIQKMTLASMLVALGVIMASPAFSFVVVLFGVPAVRIDLIAIPIIIAGVLLGPLFGLGIGILTDVLGYLLFTHAFGPYHIGFTINLALTGLIAGSIYTILSKKKASIPMSMINIGTLSILSISGIVYLLQTDSLRVGSEMVPLSDWFKIIFILGIVVFYAIILGIQWFSKRKKSKHLEHIDLFIFIVMFIEIGVGILLTPLWVQNLYGAPPYLAGVFLRIMRAMWLIPIKVYLVFYITKVSFVFFGQKQANLVK